MKSGKELAEYGAKLVSGKYPEESAAIDDAILHLARKQEQFTAEDVRKLVAMQIPSPNLFGSRFMAARMRGWIRPCGWADAERPERHGAPIRYWCATHDLIFGIVKREREIADGNRS